MPLLPTSPGVPQDPFAPQLPPVLTGKKVAPKKGSVTSHPRVVAAPVKAKPGELFTPVGGGAPIPTTPLPATGPPIPALQQYGVHMSINDVNDNVAQITQAHQAKFGYSPAPGLVFDLLKAQGSTGPLDYNQLFGIPTSQLEGKARAAAGELPSEESGSSLVPQVGDLIKSMTTAVKDDQHLGGNVNFQAWDATNADMIRQVLADPKQSEQLVQAMLKTGITQPLPVLLQGLPGSSQRAGGLGNSIMNKAMLPISQIADSTVTMPFATYKIFTAAGMDTWDVASAPLHVLVTPRVAGFINKLPYSDAGGTFAPITQPKNRIRETTHLAGIAKAVGQGMWYDINHPTTRPGYLAMDLWGLATASVSGIVRTDAAVGALRTGDVVGAGKAILFKRPPAATDLAFGAYQESLPLSETQIVRVLQEKFPVVGRQARAERLARESTDGLESDKSALINRLFGSTQSMMRRNAERRVAIDMAVKLAPVAEMTRLTRNAGIVSKLWEEMRSDHTLGVDQLSRGHKIGMQKALQLLFSDSEDPVAEWTTFHQNEIKSHQAQLDALEPPKSNAEEEAQNIYRNNARYSIAASEQQLRAIETANKIIENPPSRLKPLLDLAHEVRGNIEDLKRTIQGTGDENAIALLNNMLATHPADVGAFLRGENRLKGLNGEKFVTDVPRETTEQMIKEYTQAKGRLVRAQSRLAKRQAGLRLHPAHEGAQKSVRDAQRVVDKRNDELGSHQRAFQKLQDEGRPLVRTITEDNAGSVGPEAVRNLRAGTPGSAHFSTFPRIYRGERRLPTGRGGPDRLGLAPPNFPYQAWTGASLKQGDFEIDITRQLADEMPMVFKAARRRVDYENHWESGIQAANPPTPFHMPVRDLAKAPAHLRIALEGIRNGQQLDDTFHEAVTDAKSDELHKWIYRNDGKDLGPHVRWFDSRMAMDRVGKYDTHFWRQVDDAVGGVMSVVNEPMRLALIFATPAYALNAVGAASTLLIHTGFLAPLQLGRAMLSHKLYGPEVTRLLDAMSGETFTGSMASEMNWFTKGSRGLAHQWQKITDVQFRRAAVIHELRRHGLLKDREMASSDLYDFLRSPENAAKVSQAAQTARKAMIDFNSMSWPERATLRHIYFVYSFLRSSGIWSLRFLRDHGVMSDVLAQEGQGLSDNIDNLIGKMPYWFTHGPGYFAVHKNLVYNPVQWNMPGMIEQIGAPLSSLWNATPYQSPGNLFGPAAQFGMDLATGKDSQGNALPQPSGFEKDIPGSSGFIGRSVLDMFNQTPPGQVLSREAKAKKALQHPVPPPPVQSSYLDPLGAANSQTASELKQPVFENDTFWNGWSLPIFRSSELRHINAQAGAARYWRDMHTTNPEAYHQHQLDQVRQMVHRQEKVVGEPIPVEAQLAADMVSKVDIALETWHEQNPGATGPNQLTRSTIILDSLIQQGKKIDKAEWMKTLRAGQDYQQKGYQTQMLTEAGGLAWKNWVDRVDAINKYSLPKYTEAANNLKAMGLGNYDGTTALPRETKWAYGRQSEDVLDQAKELKAAVGSSSGYAAQVATQKWIEFVNTHDKEITVKGQKFPSPFAYQFASATDAERQKAIASYVKKSPGAMTALQAQLLVGKKPDPIIAQARATLNTWLEQEQSKLGFGKKLPPGTKSYYENIIAAKVPAYKAALSFQRLPLAKRMQVYLPIKNSANADGWKLLLEFTQARYDQIIKTPGYTKVNARTRATEINQTLVTDAWKLDVPQVMAALKAKTSKAFMSELTLYSDATNAKDPDAKIEKFLVTLVHP